MSDPMTNTEVEDVLASIRRLVSDDSRIEPEEVVPAPLDRLVLTPALRVQESLRDQFSETETNDADKLEGIEDSLQSDTEQLPDNLDASTDPEPDFLSDRAEDPVEALQDVAPIDPPELVDTSAPEPQVKEDTPDAQIEDVNHEHSAREEDNAVFEHRAPEPIQDFADTHEASDSDLDQGEENLQNNGYEDADTALQAPSAGENTPIAIETVDLDQDTLMSIHDAFADIHTEEDASDHLAAQAETIEPDALSSKIAALETLIAGQVSEEFEPESAGDGENSGTEPPTIEWEDAFDTEDLELNTIVEDADDAVQIDEQADDVQLFASDEDVLDEEALRELVSDIVREELQGALGERITRNVRKLVRREIHRALAAQELD